MKNRLITVGLAAAVSLMLLLVVACSPAAPKAVAPAADGPDLSNRVPPFDISNPQAAVRTYLDWTSLAYRFANSDLATRAASPDENVRIDSYIQLNREKGQGIDQRILRIALRPVSQETSRAVIAASEEWVYRYFSLSTRKYISEELTASYDSTYTLVRFPEGWAVDKVEADPSGAVK